MWNLGNKADEHMGREKKREANHNKVSTIENKPRIDGGRWVRGCVKCVMGIKECTCCNEYWVLYVSDESLNSPETNITLYVN